MLDHRKSNATLIAPVDALVDDRGEGLAPLGEAELVGEHAAQVDPAVVEQVEVVLEGVLPPSLERLVRRRRSTR